MNRERAKTTHNGVHRIYITGAKRQRDADGARTAGELERLLALGARRVDVGQGPDVSWVVLSDPEESEFCLLSRSVQETQRAPDGAVS